MKEDLVVAARIVDRISNLPLSTNFVWDESSIKRVLGILRSNGVELVHLNKIAKVNYSDFFNSKGYKVALKSEMELYAERRMEYERIKNTFFAHEIPLILFKSCGEFNYLGSDLDVLVRQEDRGKIRHILEYLEYPEYPLVSEPFKRAYIKITDFLDKYKVECYENIVWYSAFANAKLLFERFRSSKMDPLVDILSDEDRILAIISHNLYQERRLRLSDLVDIRRSITENFDYDYLFGVSRRRGWLDGLHLGIYLVSEIERIFFDESVFPEHIRRQAEHRCSQKWREWVVDNTNSITMPLSLPRWMFRVEYVKKIFLDHEEPFIYRLINFGRVIGKSVGGHLFKEDKGFMISISGVDGSGKTSLAMKIKKGFCKYTQISKKPKLTWSRIDGHRIMNTMYKIMKLLLGYRFSELNNIEKVKILKQRKFFRKLWIIGNSVELLLKFFVKVKVPMVLRRRVIICDRYHYDAIADMIALLPSRNNLISVVEFLLKHLTPRPDVILYLDIDPRTAANRLSRHDRIIHTSGMIEKRVQVYRELFEKEQRIHIIDTTAPLDKIARQVMKIILVRYYSR